MSIIIVNKKDLYSIHWYLEAKRKKEICTELASSSQENMKKERNCGNINKLNLETSSHSPYHEMSGSALACKMHRYNDGKIEKLSKVSQNADYTYD